MDKKLIFLFCDGVAIQKRAIIAQNSFDCRKQTVAVKEECVLDTIFFLMHVARTQRNPSFIGHPLRVFLKLPTNDFLFLNIKIPIKTKVFLLL